MKTFGRASRGKVENLAKRNETDIDNQHEVLHEC